MTVSELISYLQQFDGNTEVCLLDDWGAEFCEPAGDYIVLENIEGMK